MSLRILALTAVWGLIGVSSYAGNPTYRCDPGIVENDARIIVYPNDEVAIHGDRSKKVCPFAVNGATEDGPPARKRFNRQEMIKMIERSEINSIVLKVTAAPRVDPKQLKMHRDIATDILKTVSKDLARDVFAGLRCLAHKMNRNLRGWKEIIEFSSNLGVIIESGLNVGCLFQANTFCIRLTNRCCNLPFI